MAKNINDLRVAMVLNNFQVVLNAGAIDGVETGYSYIIYEVGPEVIDPVSGDDLGALEIVKGRFWVHQVSEAHSVAGHESDPSKTRSAANNSFSSLKLFGIDGGVSNVKVNDRAKRVS